MEMSRKAEAIKECLRKSLFHPHPLLHCPVLATPCPHDAEFKGPPDPLRGDEPYRRVRDAAKEALDAIFDSHMPVTTSAVAAANRIQGT